MTMSTTKDSLEPTTEPGYDIQGHSQVRRCRVCSSSTLKMIAATLCIAGAVATWVAMAEVLQTLNKEYKSTFFMSYFVRSSYSVLYVGWALWRYFPYCTSNSYSCNRAEDGALTNFRSLGIWSGLIAAVGLVSGYTWYLSLSRTNVPANTAIFQCAAAVVFIISVPLLKERVTVLKILCVLVSIGGVFIVAFFSTDKNNCSPANNITNSSTGSGLYEDDPCEPKQETSTPLGYVFLVVAVITYALYETFYKKFATKKDDSIPSINGIRVLGYIGIHTLLWMWPPILIFHYTGFELFHFPPTMKLFGLLVVNALMDIVFNGCLLVAIALSSPLYASVGTITAIPTSVVVDLIIHHFLPSWQAFVGIVLILTGFIGFVISEFREKTLERKHKKSSLPEEKQPLMSKAETNRQWWPIVTKYMI
ncbi:uncharacterized protein LOC135333537 isoform X2 [Halichondria panicea]|uniref:uncharacterized protein LOC135333537 isoform X2 n=1 Tax=Halichondria panicea TaxID=6063 RepID=UPI00312BACB0